MQCCKARWVDGNGRSGTFFWTWTQHACGVYILDEPIFLTMMNSITSHLNRSNVTVFDYFCVGGRQRRPS